ncbi:MULTISPECIES: ABC transporter substrate-binding protein [unclassified Prochlorococcus]|uniref:ABC transporter substrate-binding protein n=1 Tax=unclassified Prochlorococcus TaxID=2627481 RepID=UPI000533BCB2|nr:MULTISPECIES: ABC transporter substrate-binding protein [unclassified Prochlorococcus]KGG15480.1 ABC-type oligopeptide transport system periplasmic component [Prochlorococcus sp. MIT 0602]KGG17760.1 ABC-type oligopeptide transport system periplasmic component [Prochlorococcus sp. MIT 0603]
MHFKYKSDTLKNLSPLAKLGVLILLLTQISCAKSISENKVIIASKGKIESIDPAQAYKLLAIQLISSLGDTLYRINSKGIIEPILAKSVPKISKDGLTVSIELRNDVLFHDGTQFDAKAMAFTINRFINIGTLNYVIDDRINSIETPEKFLLKINLSRPSSSIKGLLSSINLTPVSPSSYSENTDKFLHDNFIGTGPYKLVSYTPEKQIIEPFKEYWGEKAKNQGVNYISLNTSTALFSAIKTGQVDILLSNSIEDGHRLALNRLSINSVLQQVETTPMQIGYIAFRTNSELLSKNAIRKALLHSLDRELISKQVSYGLRKPLRSLTPRFLWSRSTSPWPKYNINIASKLFEEAGYCKTKKLKLPLTFRSNVPSDKLLALTWKEQVKRDLSNCLEISLNGVESTTVYKQLADGVHQAVILDWTGDYPDPYAYLSPLLDCKKISFESCKEGEAVSGGTFWTNSDLQESLERSESLQGNERLKELQKAEDIASDGAALLPIWLLRQRVWFQNNLTKPEFDGSGRLLLHKIVKTNE